MIGPAPRSEITTAPGWETFDEEIKLRNLALKVPSHGIIVEIGSEYGMSTALWLGFAEPTVVVHAVDLFEGNLQTIHTQNMDELRRRFRRNQYPELIYHKGDSGYIGARWKSGPIDLLFVDGDHTYAGVCKDIRAWLPHVAVGGLVLFHDTAHSTNRLPHLLHYDVSKAIDELVFTNPNFEFLEGVDSLMVFRRNV